MNLKEFEGKALFKKYGIPVPLEFVSKKADDAYKRAFLLSKKGVKHFLLKAQIKAGKRGKSGGIIETNLKKLKKDFAKLIGLKLNGETVKEIIVAEKIPAKQYIYISIVIDRAKRCPVLVFAEDGGVDIESTLKSNPHKAHKIWLEVGEVFPAKRMSLLLKRLGYKSDVIDQLLVIGEKVLQLFTNEDATLVEINPLILGTKGKLFAVDAKVIIDDDALFKHEDLQKIYIAGQTALEKKAKAFGYSFVKLDGDLGIIGNGAGLVMSTLDVADSAGLKPANFCDVGGGASATTMEQALNNVLSEKKVKKIFINIFGGITRCDEIASGLINFLKKKQQLPLVTVRITGTNAVAAIELLNRSGIKAFATFKESINYVKNS